MKKYRVNIANKESGFIYFKTLIECEPEEIEGKAKELKTETNTITVYELKEEYVLGL